MQPKRDLSNFIKWVGLFLLFFFPKGFCCPILNDTDQASSAGCLVVKDNSVLLVRGWNRKVAPPGGKREPNESAKCTAYRETIEETGMKAIPANLLATFDTGFNLYACKLDPSEQIPKISRPLEVRSIIWLSPYDFSTETWRYPDQGDRIKELLSIPLK